IFPAVKDYIKFALMTLGRAPEAEFMFSLTKPSEIRDARRRFSLTKTDFELLNPNTKTCPVFRTRVDADLTCKIYQRVPVLIGDGDKNGNTWGVRLSTMFHMSNDSHLFKDAPGDGLLPLYEAKMIWNFDHRFSTYEGATAQNLNEGNLPQPSGE